MRIARIRADGAKQSVYEHSLATAARAALFGQKAGLSETARLAGLLHDIGKLSSAFQAYIHNSHNHPQHKALRGLIPHSTQGAKYLYEKFATDGSVSALTASVIALVTSCHHGGLMDCVSPQGTQPLYERLMGNDPKLHYEEIMQHLVLEIPACEECENLFKLATEEIREFARRSKAQDISDRFTLHLMVRFLFSCLIDADRFDAYCFEAGPSAHVDSVVEPAWESLLTALESHLATLDSAMPIDQLRAGISRRCKEVARRPPGVYQLSVPTGGGKTLASLRYALEHARLHKKERIIYIVPFTTIIDQNADEIRRILRRDDLILEHHSNITSERKREMEPANLLDEASDNHRLLTERWDSPIILTTMVQFLDTLYSGRTSAARRMHHLANAVLIFDEVQATPLNCIHLLNSGLNFLSRLCGTTVVLCTATQPLLSGVKRPLKIGDYAEMVNDVSALFRSFKRTHVVDSRVDGGYSIRDLCDFAVSRMDGLRTGLVVFNTRQDAREFFHEVSRVNEKLPEALRYNVYHLSTNLCPAHRKEILKQIRDQLKDGRVICVSTQLIEAGVNLSFQCVIRALAGLDSIAQAAGRCNRHGEDPCRYVYVVNIAGEHLRNFPSIETGQEAATRILNEIRSNPFAYGGDLLSPDALKQYYNYYFFRTESVMDYPLPSVAGNATMYDLLSDNSLGRAALANRRGTVPPLIQAFGTAGEHFCVIEDDTTPLLVPYKAGEAVIERLRREDLRLEERRNALRIAQQYSVNVFSHVLTSLEKERAIEMLPGGLLVLNQRFYDAHIGVTTTGKPMTALFA